MKLEILKKLIALANNNPNDNEANLAARKVCKALIEDKYIDQLRDVAVPPHTVESTIPPNYRPHPKQEAYYNYSKPFTNDSTFWEEFFGYGASAGKSDRRKNEDKFRGGYWTDPSSAPPPRTEPPPHHPEDEKYYKRRKERGFGDETRNLKCKTCGKVKKTIFVGIEELFECNECTWSEFEKGKKPPKEEQRYGSVCHMTGYYCPTPVTCADLGCSKRV